MWLRRGDDGTLTAVVALSDGFAKPLTVVLALPGDGLFPRRAWRLGPSLAEVQDNVISRPRATFRASHCGSKRARFNGLFIEAAAFGSKHPHTVRLRWANVSAAASWPSIPQHTHISRRARCHFRSEYEGLVPIRRASCCPRVQNTFEPKLAQPNVATTCQTMPDGPGMPSHQGPSEGPRQRAQRPFRHAACDQS
jgi:hypothetical protein